MRHRPALRILLAVTAVHLAGTAHAVNYVPNPGFETCASTPASWTPVATDGVACNGTDPHAGTFSLALSNGANVGLARAQSDCTAVPPGNYLADASCAYRTAASEVYQVALSVYGFTDAGCASSHSVTSLGAGVSFGATLFTDGQWHTLGPSSFLSRASSSIRRR